MELNAKTIDYWDSSALNVNAIELALEGPGITRITPGVFDRYKSLQVLSLSRNNLTVLPGGIFNSLINLKDINLSYNKIKAVNVKLFKNNKTLEIIRLANNNISDLNEGLFDDLPALQDLHLSENNLTEIPERIFDTLKNLKEIWLDSNKIKLVNVNLFKNNKKLEIIQLDNNNISELDERLFSDLPELQELYIHSNKIKTFDFRSLRSSTKLSTLNFIDNNLSEINELDNLKELFPQLEECGVCGNNFSKLYLKRVIESLESQGVEIFLIDKSKGIQDDSVYGLKCVPDDYLLRRVDELTKKHEGNQKENEKLREELQNTNNKLDEMQKLILELQQTQQSQDHQSTTRIRSCEVNINRLHDQINDYKTFYETERPIMLKNITEMLGHYESYQKRVDKLRIDTANKFFREKVELRKKMAFSNERNVLLEDLINNCQTRIDCLDDKWCQQVDEHETAYMAERSFILSSLNQLTRGNKSNHKSIVKIKTKTLYEQMNKIFKKNDEKFKTFQDEMVEAVENANLIYIKEKPLLLKRLNEFTLQHDTKQQEADDWKVEMINKIVRLNKRFTKRNIKCESQNRQLKASLSKDGKKICKLQNKMIQKVEDSFYKMERPAIFKLLERFDEEQRSADVQLKSIREDGQKEVNGLKTECKVNFDKLSEDIQRCNAACNAEIENIQKLIVKNDDDMKKLVGEMRTKINNNKNSEEEGRQVIWDKCNQLESGHKNLEEKPGNVDVQLTSIREDGQKDVNGLRKDFDLEFDKLSEDIEECDEICNTENVNIKESIRKNDDDMKTLESVCKSLEIKQPKNENDMKDNRIEVDEFRVDIRNTVTSIESKLDAQITSTEPILAHYKTKRLKLDQVVESHDVNSNPPVAVISPPAADNKCNVS